MNMIAKQRLLLTADKTRLVADGDPDGATLYCTPGTEIPESAAKLFGLVDGRLGGAPAIVQSGAGDPGNDPATGGSKEALPGGDKEKAPGEDKEKKPDGDKGDAGASSDIRGVVGSVALEAAMHAYAQPAYDLTKVKGVGPKVAEGFAKAGIVSFVQIAAIDPASPPAVEGTRATTNWAGIVASAKELVAAAPAATDTGAETASGDGGSGNGAADQKAD